MYPNMNPSLITKGLSFIKTIKWSSILDGTSKTLNVINQAIPIVYQVKPIFSNVKTLVNIANNLNDNASTSESDQKEETNSTQNNNSPIFYIN